MALSDGEKLIITMLADIQIKLGINDTVDPHFVRKVVDYDFWAIKEKHSGIFGHGEREPADVRFVKNALDMWLFVEESFESLSPDQQEQVKANASMAYAPRLAGFDGHTELASIARLLVHDLGYWQRFADRGDLDSHSPDRDMHGRMVKAFEVMRPRLNGRNLTAEELTEVLIARIHPDNR